MTCWNESMAETCRGSSTPPRAATSVARISKSGGLTSGGNVQVKTRGIVNPSGGSPSGSSMANTASSNPSSVRGSTSRLT